MAADSGLTGKGRGISAPLVLLYDRFRDAELVGKHVVNLVLMVLTLGLYRFWAVTRMRRVVWLQTSLGGQSFEYSGTGLEIFLGFVKVFFLVLLPIGISFAALDLLLIDAPRSSLGSGTFDVVGLAYAVVILFLLEMGRFLSWRYRVSRTRWHAVRSRIDISARKFSGIALVTSVANIISGWIVKPLIDIWRARVVINHLDIGGLRPTFDGKWGRLFAIWAGFLASFVVAVSIAVALIVVPGVYTGSFVEATIGNPVSIGSVLSTVLPILAVLLVPFWMYNIYRAAFWRHVCDRTRVGPLRFRFTGSGAGLLVLTITNLLILILSLGILAPITWRRRIEYISQNLTIDGTLDPSDLRQVAEDLGSTGGEGLLGDFDIA